MKKQLFRWEIIFTVALFLFGTKTAFATAPLITSYPLTTININQSFTVVATMSGLSGNSDYRLRIALAQQRTSNYFGSTFDGTNWHYGSVNDGNFLTVKTDNNGTWFGNIQGEVDSEDPNFTTGSGTYDLKIGRYTQTGTSATWSDPVSVSIYFVPTPTSTPTPIPTNTPAPTSIPPTSTPTSKPISTKSPTSTAVLKNASSASESSTSSSSGEILGAKASIMPTRSPVNKKGWSIDWFPILTIGSGMLILIYCGILFYQNYKKQQEDA